MASILLKDLSPGTNYAIQLRTDTGDGVSEWSRLFTIPTMTDTTPPDVPAWISPQVNAWVPDGDTFVAQWVALDLNLDQNRDFDHYELMFTANSLTKIVKTQNTAFVLTFESNRTFFNGPQPVVKAKVRSVDANGNVSNWSNELTATNPAPGQPLPPDVGSVATASVDSIMIAWKAPTGATDNDIVAFNVYVGSTSGFTPSASNRVYQGNANRFTYNSTTYSLQYIKIRALDKFGQESIDLTANATPTSPFTPDTTAPNNATTLVATSGFDPTTQNGYIDLTWVASTSTDVASYVIRYGVDGTNFQQMTTNGSATGVRINGTIPNSTYYVSIKAKDWMGNETASWLNASTYPITTVKDTTAPSQPSAPTAAVSTQRIQVTAPTTKQAGGAMESDVAYYEVYASNASGFTPSTTNMIGSIPFGPAMVETFNIPATASSGNTETWYVKVKAVDKAGLQSPSSNQATAAVGLIDTTSIADLAVTTAKITSLNVDKLTAGSGLINDMVVKSKLTLGDASTTGYIETYDYTTSSGATGTQISKNGIIVRSGSIEATALKIARGQNIIPAGYADFERGAAYYTAMAGISTVASIKQTPSAKYNGQFLNIKSAGTVSFLQYMANTSTDYNFPVTAGTKYIVSAWVRNRSAVSTNVFISLKWGNATTTTSGGTTPTVSSNTWARHSFVTAAAPAGVTSALFYVSSLTTTAGAEFDIDGIQVEAQVDASVSTPSNWTPPGVTTVDGGQISTGSLVSNSPAKVTSVVPVYDTNGVLVDTIVSEIDDPNGRVAYSITTDGNADFSRLSVRGNVVVGNPLSGGPASTFTQTLTGVGTTNTQPTLTAPIGTFIGNDVGRVVAGTGITVGTTITAVGGDGATATMSASATATATISVTIPRDYSIVSTMSSANYIKGSQGWTVRSDGMAEFRQLAADSIDGIAIRANTLSALAIKTGELSADITLTGSLNSSSDPTELLLTTTSGSTTVTTPGSPVTFDPTDVTLPGVIITGPGIPPGTRLIARASSTSATMSAPATASGTNVNGLLYRGRNITLSGEGGIILSDAFQRPIVTLPTNGDTAVFTGSIVATDLYVNDEFRMNGLNNYLGQSSVLNLSAGAFRPASWPRATFDWSYFKMTAANGNDYVPSSDVYLNPTSGGIYDYANDKYYTPSNFYGPRLAVFIANGGTKAVIDWTIDMSPILSGGSAAQINGGISADASNFWFLYQDTSASVWRLAGVTRAGMSRSGGPVIGDLISNSVWADANTGATMLGYPGVAKYGGKSWVAKRTAAGVMIHYYNATTMGAGTVVSSVQTAASMGGSTPFGFVVGKFDFGVGTNTYGVLTTQGSNAKALVFLLGSGGSVGNVISYQPQLDFPLANAEKPLTLAYVGTSNDDTAGRFQTLTLSGKVYDYTKLMNNTSNTTLTTQLRLRNDGTNPGYAGSIGYSSASLVGNYNVIKRARLTLSNPVPLSTINVGGNSPNAVTYYVGEGSGTRYRQPELGTMVESQTITSLLTSDAAGSAAASGTADSATTLINGISSKIQSLGLMEITGDGTAAFTNVKETRLIGEIRMWIGAVIGTNPTYVQDYAGVANSNWLICNGGTFSSVDYPELASFLGDKFGTHSGSTYYLPTYALRSPLGYSSGTNGVYVGSSSYTLSSANLPAHAHTINHDHAAFNISMQYSTNTGTGGTAVRVTDIQSITGGGGSSDNVVVDVPSFSGSSGNGPGTGTALTIIPNSFYTQYMIRAK